MSSKRWCITLNNPEGFRLPYSPVDTDYLVWQLERGANGTEHIQGYVRFKNKIRLAAVKRVLDNQALHAVPAKGSEQQNKDYCTKEDTRVSGPYEHGTYNADAGKQGTRSDLKAATDLIAQGQTLKQVAEAHPDILVKYPTGLEKLALLLAPPPPLKRALQVHVLWGPTNTGKTHRVMTAFPGVYSVHPGRDPWGRYQREDVILFDEFDWSKWSVDQMKTILDVWPLTLDARYVDRVAHWTKVFITCNSDPTTWWLLPPGSADRAAIERRIQTVTRVTAMDQAIVLLPTTAPALPTPSASSAGTSSAPPRATTPVLISSEDEDENPQPLKKLRRCNAADLSF